MFVSMIQISKIFLYKYASRIFFLEFYPFVTEISFWCEKTSQGIIFIFTYSRLGWSLMNNAIEIGVRHFFSTWALFRGGVPCHLHLTTKYKLKCFSYIYWGHILFSYSTVWKWEFNFLSCSVWYVNDVFLSTWAPFLGAVYTDKDIHTVWYLRTNLNQIK